MPSPHRILSMLKGRERFVLRYAVGMELAALQQLIIMARAADYGSFNWSDAAILSYQLGAQVSRQSACGPDQACGTGQCGTGVPPVNMPASPPLAGHEGEWVFDEPAGEDPPCA